MAAVASVSIDEDKNSEVEIPRHDPKDKSKLWISKVEIHHNTMMEKIRGLVQVKLFEMVAKDDGFFNGIEDVAIEIEDMEGHPKPDSEEELLLAKKAQMLTDILNAIMDLPKDEILTFLTSSSLPTGLNRRSKNSSKPETSEEPQDNNSNKESQQQQQQPQEDENFDEYNWILDCGDAWKDLPPVVRLNAMELGYNQTSWDEDAQDLPVFRTLWKELTPNQRTAAIFLGNYDETIWNEDAQIMLMAGKHPSEMVDESLSTEKPKMDPKEDATIATASTDVSLDRFVDEVEDDDDDDVFNELVSKFSADTNDEPDEAIDGPVYPPKHEIEDEDAMMEEFLSNFGDSAEKDKETITRDPVVPPTSAAPKKGDDDEDAMMEEFLSNFGDSAEKDKETITRDPVVPPTSAAPKEGDDDEDAMMDEFMANFVTSDGDESSNHSSDEESQEKQPTPAEDRVAKDDGENDDEDSDAAMMNEFFSNFVVPNKKDGDDKTDAPIKNLVPNYDSVREDNSDGSDEEQPLIVSNPRKLTMDRGFEGETSPLLATSTEAKTIAAELDKPEAEPTSTWDTLSSYLYWIPVVVGLPAVYMLATGSNSSP